MEVVKHISSRAERLISEYGLGHIRVEYSEHMLKRSLLFAALLPVGLAMLALVLPTLLAPELTDGNWWQRMGNLSYFLMGGSCLSFVSLLGIVMLVITLWKGEKRLYLGDKGFILVRRQIETVGRWDTVREIYRHFLFMKRKSENVQQVTSICSYTVIPAEGKKCSFAADPGPIIEAAVTTSQFPRLLENYENGKTLAFGWLALQSKGLHLTPEVPSEGHEPVLARLPGTARMSPKVHGTCVESGERFLPWEQLACYWIDETQSTLILSRPGERKHWAILPLSRVANPSLCLKLIEHVRSGDTRQTA